MPKFIEFFVDFKQLAEFKSRKVKRHMGISLMQRPGFYHPDYKVEKTEENEQK